MSEAKKRKKSYYVSAKKQCTGRQKLDAGMKGFLITCNRMEKQAVREAYNILNEYSQLLYGEVIKTDNQEVHNAEVDFDKLISTQVEAVQSRNGTLEKQFSAVDTKTSNCIFIKASSLDRPDEVISRLFSDVVSTGKAKSRSILKIFPVLGTCRATEDKIEQLVEEVIRTHFANGLLGTYAILYKVRCNSLSREPILSLVGRAVHHASPSSRVDLSNPDHIVSIDVLNKFACVSILKDFYKLKKYNLQELAVKINEPASEQQCPSASEISAQNAQCDKIIESEVDTSELTATEDSKLKLVLDKDSVDASASSTQTVGRPEPDSEAAAELDDHEPLSINVA